MIALYEDDMFIAGSSLERENLEGACFQNIFDLKINTTRGHALEYEYPLFKASAGLHFSNILFK